MMTTLASKRRSDLPFSSISNKKTKVMVKDAQELVLESLLFTDSDPDSSLDPSDSLDTGNVNVSVHGNGNEFGEVEGKGNGKQVWVDPDDETIKVDVATMETFANYATIADSQVVDGSGLSKLLREQYEVGKMYVLM